MKKINILTSVIFAPALVMSLPLTLVSCGNETYKNPNPHESVEDQNIIKSLESIKRLDKDGYLYFMENNIDYYNNEYITTTMYVAEQALKGWTTADTFTDACSAFCAYDSASTEFNMMTGRAYDYPHTYKDGAGNSVNTGLNLMIHTPKNESYGVKYESIGTTDAFLVMNAIDSKANIKNGSLDDGVTDTSIVSILPWVTMDGINDQGLTASILMLPLDNQIPTTKTESTAVSITRPASVYDEVSIERAVRYVLDGCSSVSEAETLLKQTWFNRILQSNFHLFVTDKNGESRLFEWNMSGEDATTQNMTITKTNAVTNFYQTFSDCDSSVPQITGLKNSYHYGYARNNYVNAYNRFNTIVSMLDFYTKDAPAAGEISHAKMQEQTLDALLRVLSLYPAPASDNQTQFSCLFKSKTLTQKIYSFSDLSKSWTYSLKEHKFINE